MIGDDIARGHPCAAALHFEDLVRLQRRPQAFEFRRVEPEAFAKDRKVESDAARKGFGVQLFDKFAAHFGAAGCPIIGLVVMFADGPGGKEVAVDLLKGPVVIDVRSAIAGGREHGVDERQPPFHLHRQEIASLFANAYVECASDLVDQVAGFFKFKRLDAVRAPGLNAVSELASRADDHGQTGG